MEDKLKLANEFSEKLYSGLEKNITINAMNILKTMNLDKTCLLSSILYYPYCKVVVVNKMDMARGNIEEAKVKELEKIRAEFKNNIKQVYGEEVLNFLHSLKKLIEIDWQKTFALSLLNFALCLPNFKLFPKIKRLKSKQN